MDTKDLNNDRAFHRKLFDSKSKVITCVHCKQTSQECRDLMQCDFCEAYWHTDCLEQPRANAHKYSANNSRDAWMCPLHFEHDMKLLDPIQRNVLDVAGGRSHRLRKPKNLTSVPLSERRTTKKASHGLMGNGLIDVEMSESEDEFEYSEDEGTITRIPRKSIQLDFINKVKA